jgi:hypothetical protein
MRPHRSPCSLISAALLAFTSFSSAGAQVVLPGHASTSQATHSPGAQGVTAVVTPTITSRWTFLAPTLDGVINGAEWVDATVLNISLGGNPVMLFVKNDADYLYIAVDDQNTPTLVMYDRAGIFFDDEGGVPPMLGDGQWTHAVCPSTEGELDLGQFVPDFATNDLYQGFVAGGVGCGYESGPAGMTGGFSAASGHMQYEMKISLSSSNLHALPGQTFGALIFSYSPAAGGYTGGTTNPATAPNPSTYEHLALATPPALAATNVIYGTQGGSGALLVSIDQATGLATTIGSSGQHLSGLAVSPTGELFATTQGNASALYRLDATNGQAFPVGSTGVDFMDAIAFDRSGNLWGLANAGGGRLYRINRTTGVATLVGPTGQFIGGLAFDPMDGTAFGSAGGGVDAIFRVNLSSGAATLIGATGIDGSTPDICFDVNGRLFGVKGSGGAMAVSDLIAIDKSTGAGAVIGSTGVVGISGLGSQAFLGLATTNRIYGTQGAAGDLFARINPVTGSGTAIGSTGAGGLTGLAVSRSGMVYASSGGAPSNLYQLDAATGKAYLVGPTGTNFMSALAFDIDGNLWGLAGSGPETLYHLNISTAAGTPVGVTGEQLAGMAFDPYTGRLYASSGGAGAVTPDAIFTVDTSTGAITLVGTTGLGGDTPDIAFDAAAKLYGVKGGPGPATLISINKLTGAGAVIGPVGLSNISGLGSAPWAAVADASPLTTGTTRTMLQPARPNPFTSATEMRFSLGQAGAVKIDVFNVLGQHVTRLVDGSMTAGEHFVRWTGSDAAGRPVGDGVYYLRLRAADATETRAVVRIH